AWPWPQGRWPGRYRPMRILRTLRGSPQGGSEQSRSSPTAPEASRARNAPDWKTGTPHRASHASAAQREPSTPASEPSPSTGHHGHQTICRGFPSSSWQHVQYLPSSKRGPRLPLEGATPAPEHRSDAAKEPAAFEPAIRRWYQSRVFPPPCTVRYGSPIHNYCSRHGQERFRKLQFATAEFSLPRIERKKRPHEAGKAPCKIVGQAGLEVYLRSNFHHSTCRYLEVFRCV